MLQETINKRQNSAEMLKCQFAARHYYNTAENYSTAAFICSLVSLLFILAPDRASSLYSVVVLLIPLAFDAASLILYWRMDIFVSSAALLRNYFDETVLEIKTSKYTGSVIRKVNSLIVSAIEKDKKGYDLQISHNGRDNPPGVRDWYEFSHQYADSDVIFECQKQNCWWNDKLCHRRLLWYGAIVLLGIILGSFFGFHANISILRIIVCLLSAIITFADRFIENLKYIRLSIRINDRYETLEVSKNQELIASLQELISQRRELRVVEINRIHKKHSKKLSERYEQITKDS